MESRWLSVDEIAEYLGVKRDTIYKWIYRRNMPAHKLGRLWKFRMDEVDEWVFANDGNRNESSMSQVVSDVLPASCGQNV